MESTDYFKNMILEIRKLKNEPIDNNFINEGLLFESLNKISTQGAIDNKLIYPVYHGTNEQNYSTIIQQGFKAPSSYDSEHKKNSYGLVDYYDKIPPPTDHLGFGIYFTKNKSIAQTFNKTGWEGKRRLPIYAINAPNFLEINFAAPRTMMKWWLENGYNEQKARDALKYRNYRLRDEATKELTDNLSSKYDAIHFKGKTIYRTLDGDQFCVYDPKNIYIINDSDAKIGDINSKVSLKDGSKGKIVEKRKLYDRNIEWYKTRALDGDDEMKKIYEKISSSDGYYYTVKLSNGKKIYNLLNVDFNEKF
jgi:hypothetical protein